MAPTPPTRVTRARSAATKSKETTSVLTRKLAPSKVTKPTTTRKTKPTKTDEADEIVQKDIPTTTATAKGPTLAAAPRRRIKVTPLEVSAPQEESVAEPKKAAARSTRAKVEQPAEKEIKTSISKSRTTTKPTKTSTTKVTTQPAGVSKSKGRPKKAAVVTEPEPTEDVPKPTRQTRARSGSNAEATSLIAAPPSKAVPKKKVTFQDLPEDDKENIAVPVKKTATKKDSTPATGMRAKPVRKPVPTATKKKTTATTSAEKTPIVRALTPKKITQIARPTTPEESDEEDILAGEKTPIRVLNQSPKRNPELATQLSPVKKLDFTQPLLSASQEQPSQSVLQSPARRPPASPFKEILKDSPRRGDVSSVFKDVVPSEVSVATTLVSTSHNHPMLLQSPKRAPIDSSIFSQSVIKPQKTPLKASLLFSPAKRFLSPLKQRTPAVKSTVIATEADDSTLEDVAVSSHFRGSISPQRSVKVHKMSEEELEDELRNDVNFDDSVLNVRSPLKVLKTKPVFAISPARESNDDEERQTQSGAESDSADISASEPEIDIAERPDEDGSETDQLSDASASPLPNTVDSMADVQIFVEQSNRVSDGPRLSLFKSTHFRQEEESSEDELAADETPKQAINLFRSSLTGLQGRNQKSNIGFTPLAAQIRGWAASSPEKKTMTARNTESESFSPVAAQHIDGQVQVDRPLTPQTARSSRMRRSTNSRLSTAGRASMAASSILSPEQASYFADQMAAQEAADQIEQDQEEADLHALVEAQEAESEEQDVLLAEADDESASDKSDDTVIVTEGNGELTTDLIKYTNASDTAMVDFAQLAQEADELAAEDEHIVVSSGSIYGDENAAPPHEQDLDHDQAIESPGLALDTVLPAQSPSSVAMKSVEYATPIRPDLSKARFLNTVICKVPLKPEGEISPIKISKKRSLSFSAAPGPAKRRQLVPVSEPVRSVSEDVLSPQRGIRSAAPSPAHTTPGQMSFAIDDFGDSTLDGIELPEDDMDFDVTQTPATAKSTKSYRRASGTPSRTPLKAVGSGVLHGAVVYVDVHTTEGADASGIFVDLLTQMGARCVKEWRWNPRASDELTPGRIGVTHVVFKDGSKRTLEKVRDAKGEVWCVGVGWVLDCERENKWLDESNYAVDQSIIPRGGSRRRKSMEPRALVNANGNLSTSRSARRSVSGEMTEKMKEELINTPVRSYQPKTRESLATTTNGYDDDDDDENTEISSTYNSPTTTMNVGLISTPTALVGWDPATAQTPGPVDTPYLMAQGSKLVQQSCPPKQINKGLFDDGESGVAPAGKSEVLKEDKLKLRLAEARRRTMGWKPRFSSPLRQI